jgi:hypothetical protein
VDYHGVSRPVLLPSKNVGPEGKIKTVSGNEGGYDIYKEFKQLKDELLEGLGMIRLMKENYKLMTLPDPETPSNQCVLGKMISPSHSDDSTLSGL